ncbi:8855_t:CDS:2, partial [Acaulospora morrowiae]
ASITMGRLKKNIFICRANAERARKRKKPSDSNKDVSKSNDDILDNNNDMPINNNNEYDLEKEEVAKELKIATIGSHKISQFFNQVDGQENNKMDNQKDNRADSQKDSKEDSKTNNQEDDQQLDYESESNLTEGSLQWKQRLQETTQRVQCIIDKAKILKSDKVKYTSVIYYIQLLQHNMPKIEASRIVAKIYNGGEYCAKCI